MDIACLSTDACRVFTPTAPEGYWARAEASGLCPLPCCHASSTHRSMRVARCFSPAFAGVHRSSCRTSPEYASQVFRCMLTVQTCREKGVQHFVFLTSFGCPRLVHAIPSSRHSFRLGWRPSLLGWRPLLVTRSYERSDRMRRVPALLASRLGVLGRL